MFTDGATLLDVEGSQPIRVLSVESLGGSAVLHFLGAALVSPKRQYTSTEKLHNWPPTNLNAKEIYALGDVQVTPSAANWHQQPFELLLGYRVMAKGFAVRTGVRVTYEVGSHRYQATLPFMLTACPPSEDQQKCSDRAWPD